MSLKSTFVPALYFAGALTFGTLGMSDATKTLESVDTYTFMKQGAKSSTFDIKKQAQYDAFMARDDIYWYGAKTGLEFFLTGVLGTMGIKRSRRED